MHPGFAGQGRLLPSYGGKGGRYGGRPGASGMNIAQPISRQPRGGGLFSGTNPDGSRRTQRSGWANPNRFQWSGAQDQALFDSRRGPGGGPAYAQGSPEWKRLIQMSMAGGGERLGREYDMQQRLGDQAAPAGPDLNNPMISSNPNYQADPYANQPRPYGPPPGYQDPAFGPPKIDSFHSGPYQGQMQGYGGGTGGTYARTTGGGKGGSATGGGKGGAGRPDLYGSRIGGLGLYGSRR
jgi:hypothetical protein